MTELMEYGEHMATQTEHPVPEGPIHPGAGRKRFDWRRILAPFGAVLLLIAKVGAKLKALLILLPKIKLFTTAGTMLVSIGAYSLIWGWRFAVGFVLLLLVHELGHVFQLRREGVKASAPMFIPFLGAVIWAKSFGGNALSEARVALAGPIVGGLGTAAVALLAFELDSDLLRALAFTGFFLNLFNLLPVLPLDGGRAMAALSPVMWIFGFVALVALTFAFPNPILPLIALLGGLETWRRWKERNSPEARAYYEVPLPARLLIAASYIALAGLLGYGMAATHLARNFGDV
jgi:Zn-dependent protease